MCRPVDATHSSGRCPRVVNAPARADPLLGKSHLKISHTVIPPGPKKLVRFLVFILKRSNFLEHWLKTWTLVKLRPVVDVDAGRVLPQVFDLSEFRDHAGSSAISPDFCDESHSRSDKSNPVVKKTFSIR